MSIYSPDEDTVLFGDYSDLGVEELYEEGVIVDSCLSSRNNSRFGDADFIEEEFDGDHEEEQVHFFGTPDTVIVDQVETLKEEPLVTVKKEDEKEEKEEKEAQLLVKIGSLSGLANDSVVSTPDVVNDVIMLECEGFFRKRQTGHEEEENTILTQVRLLGLHLREYLLSQLLISRLKNTRVTTSLKRSPSISQRTMKTMNMANTWWSLLTNH